MAELTGFEIKEMIDRARLRKQGFTEMDIKLIEELRQKFPETKMTLKMLMYN